MVVDGTKLLGVLGKQVRSSTGEDMGRIVDVIITCSARVRAAVIGFGEFLGVGNRQIAVAWSAIRLPAQDKPGARLHARPVACRAQLQGGGTGGPSGPVRRTARGDERSGRQGGSRAGGEGGASEIGEIG